MGALDAWNRLQLVIVRSRLEHLEQAVHEECPKEVLLADVVTALYVLGLVLEDDQL